MVICAFCVISVLRLLAFSDYSTIIICVDLRFLRHLRSQINAEIEPVDKNLVFDIINKKLIK